MANEIKQLYTTGEFTITGLAGLVSSTAAAPTGWMSDLVDNTTYCFGQVLVFAKVTQGISPTSSKSAYVYAVRGDTNFSPHVTDGQTTGQSRHIVQNAPFLGVMVNKVVSATNDPLYGEFLFDQPGPKFGVTISHDTAVSLNTTGSTHYVRWIGINPNIQ